MKPFIFACLATTLRSFLLLVAPVPEVEIFFTVQPEYGPSNALTLDTATLLAGEAMEATKLMPTSD
jgi:hypothetical protein